MSSPGVSNSTFDFGTRLGLVFIVESAALSAVAVSSLLLYIAYSAIAIHRNASRKWTTDTHIHYYFLNLMAFDLVQAIGGLMDIRWIAMAQVTPGPLCTTQGLFKQMGDVGVAFSTIAIALHTLHVLVFRWHTPPRMALLVLLGIWVIVALLVGIPSATQSNYYGPTGYWCWIARDNFERIGLEYLWLWIAAFLNIVVYVFLALVVKRVIVIDGHKIRWPKYMTTKTSSHASSDDGSRDEGAIALQMLFYPAVYVITVLPIAAARFSQFHNHDVPFAVTAFADTLFASSGLFNVTLYALTRPKLLPQRHRRNTSSVMLSTVAPTSRLSRYSRSHGRVTYGSDDFKMEDGELSLTFASPGPESSSFSPITPISPIPVSR
ncbi:hypothetical protein BV22DRAFT_199840 [Leucogyrophana mollusca]|uniref:Uncharacterized protein n=1 Tax=Leucogyrophana mollusca TaxID=85980 RepID=A0ACB8BSX3_9AGAM|nr:hypothetical protein BV22DRAFT_199840 [Leucogyrophana mollusca]